MIRGAHRCARREEPLASRMADDEESPRRPAPPVGKEVWGICSFATGPTTRLGSDLLFRISCVASHLWMRGGLTVDYRSSSVMARPVRVIRAEAGRAKHGNRDHRCMRDGCRPRIRHHRFPLSHNPGTLPRATSPPPRGPPRSGRPPCRLEVRRSPLHCRARALSPPTPPRGQCDPTRQRR